MAVDSLSPIAPARIRALLLPVGRIKRSRFLAFVDLLRPHCMVRLGDVSPDSRPDRNMFSPLAFPHGTLLYDLSTSLPTPSQAALAPFEIFREPLLIIGVGDAAEYPWPDESRDHSHVSDETQHDMTDLLDRIREQFPKAYLHTLMMFACATPGPHPLLPQETIYVPPASQQKTTTMKTIVCDVTSKLLAEMTTLARSIQALPTVPSPASQMTSPTDGNPGWMNSDSVGSQSPRRNSQIPAVSRPDSPSSINSRDLHRMSMPVLPSANPSLATDDSSSSTQGTRTPPTTFDDIPAVANSISRTNSTSSKPPAATRDASADRVSIHGFGSGGVGERARNKGRGRISIVIGTLYLCAGQWHEALKELSEGASRARALSDHLWHAKALESILVCLLLFAWAGMDFQIPQVCSPTGEKSSGTKSPQHTPSNSISEVSAPTLPPPTSHELALENLNALIPDLVNMILSIYNRASNFAGESLPPLAFSECVIRFSKLLTAMNLSAGYLDDDALQHLVQNTPFRQKPRLSVPRLSVNPTRNDIANMLFRALPGHGESSGFTPTDRVVVLAGVASVLSALGMQRKKAIVIKEFITSLIPGLVQARKVGAAEMGVHPAAGLAALANTGGGGPGVGSLHLGEGEIESGMDEFLGLLGRIYGIPGSNSSLDSSRMTTKQLPNGETGKMVIEDILETSSLRSFGSLNLKLDILRLCINFCEALPDFKGVLHFTSLLLRVAGPGTAPKSNSTDVIVSLPHDEQVRLYANLSRTVIAANKLGLQQVLTDYWDDFMVRGIQIVEEPAHLRLVPHRPAEMKSATSGREGPFIHNPWVKRPTSTPTETVLVADEEYKFIISLQNPYDFELEVESLRVAADGVDFSAQEQFFILGPYRTQKFPITGIARTSGILTITGCLVKVAGCRERLFPIFSEPWKPERESKLKSIGLSACLGAPVSRPSSAVDPAVELRPSIAPKMQTLTFSVIESQPLLTVADVSLPQGSVMLLEGESKPFTVTLKNTSLTTAVDFVHVTFQDSASSALQAAMSNKDLPAAELHELEVQLAQYPSLKWCRKDEEESLMIPPGGMAAFDIEVVGRTRLTDAIIQFDYAHLGKRRSDVEERFFTRQLFVPVAITVNASVQLQRPDIVSLSGDFAWSVHQDRSATKPSNFIGQPSSPLMEMQDPSFLHFLSQRGGGDYSDEYCLLLLDLRNSWPNPLSVSLHVRSSPKTQEDLEDTCSKSNSIEEVIQPGHVNRIVLALPKLYLKDPHAPVPSLNPANQRQFVVSTSKISPEAERASREAFWYRHELLKLVRGTWEEHGSGRRGNIDLRSIRFSPRMVEAIKLDDVRIDMTVAPDNLEITNKIIQTGRAKFQVTVDEFLTLRTTIYNRSPQPISPLLRLQPHLAGLPHGIALDLDKRFSWTGVLQHKLPVVQPGDSVQSELGIVALCSGIFEIAATVDEVAFRPQVDPAPEPKNRPRSGTATLMDTRMLGERRLRSWHLKEPCVIVARRIEAE
ncbi:hypercellular protein A [Westerdykella ornata]|uniref:Hypercellular protein A n=1 Tax=Westerdykella ornata TaxID=318751 RepID=A0A6A6JXB2_WESOR|nr:hypercellular protein A [Westerdykella ornata]KAF2280376.1 hypercellular protein A [Westerdykella ornata]